jgi:hypothetical protein
MARMISELNKPADIMASADFKVVDKALIPKWADWNIRFASNQLVLCYTDQNRYAGEVNHSNWYEILGREDLGWGHSDPNLDPCGYRSLMVLQLAEKYYNTPSLYDRLIANRPQKNIRPKSVEHVRLFTTPPEGQPPNLLEGFISRISNQGVYSDVAVDVSNLQFQSIPTTSKLHTIDHIIGHRVFLSVAPKNIHFI